MKLIIDIDEDDYKEIIEEGVALDYFAMGEAIKNGTLLTKAETVTEFADRCRECGTHFIPVSVLQDIKAELNELKSNFMPSSGVGWGVKMCLEIIDKHIENEDKK